MAKSLHFLESNHEPANLGIKVDLLIFAYFVLAVHGCKSKHKTHQMPSFGRLLPFFSLTSPTLSNFFVSLQIN